MFLLLLSLLVFLSVILIKQNLSKAHSYMPVRVDDVERHRRYNSRKRL